ncbi:D-alanyl-lipoteichoic acid biosynthesis protein DltD [Carboxylicivirga sp. N1Y90]|uniref:D-alanyl-lipoteichoic acid biosynthesis protein DltD n=1 Tax=Carboxylicivirga fragile TaxID=3417571 RepID=UPI003D341049|nr:hypothetical protein [Marinilabiliaceae bacterium N1Y90]
MKVFLKDCIRFLLIVFVAAILLEITMRMLPNDYKVKKEYLEAHCSEIEVLILGTSQTYYGVDPNYIDAHAYNAAYVSQTLNFDLAILEKYSTSLGSLKTLIVPISYISLFVDLESGKENWRVKNYNLYHHLNKSNRIGTNSEVFGNNLFVNMKRLFYFVIGKPLITTSDLGWGIDFKSTDGYPLLETGISASKRHTINDYTLLNQNMEVIKRMHRICQNNNTQLVLISAPTHKHYNDRLNDTQLQLFNNAINTLVLETEVKYYDFRNDERFKDSDFFDAIHLNEKGAKKLTELLNDTVLSE